jgi:tetratricopeptide (TPR) repeat protein
MNARFRHAWWIAGGAILIAWQLGSPATVRSQTAGTGDAHAAIPLLQSGAAAMHQGKPAEAEGYFKQAIAAAPNMPDGYLGLGMSELREGKAEDAETALVKALELNPDLRGAHMFLGIAEYQSNHLDAAAASLQQEIKVQPDNVEALTWLGIVELGAGHPDEAVGPLDRAAALNPKDPNVLDYRGRAHALVAQESYRALSALDPDSWRVHRALGEIASESKQWQDAINEYRRAIEKLATNPDLYESLGEALQHLSRFDEATHAYEEELKLSPHNAIALYNLGRIQVLSGDPKVGVDYLRKAMEQHIKSGPADYYLGLGLAQTGHADEALTWLEKSLQENPSDFVKQGAYFQLAKVYQTLHRPEDAQRAAEELKKLKAASSRTGGTPETP